MDYEPSQKWLDELAEKALGYKAAKASGQYGLSDALRKELTDSGVVDLDTLPSWHPVFESVESRSSRLACPPP